MRFNLKKTISSGLGICIILLVSAGIVYGLNTWNTGYKVNNGASATVYVAGTSNYRVVTNTSGTNRFVPSKTTGEMNAYCASSGAACYTCTESGWGNLYRSNTIDHDTGAGSIGHSQAYCLSWCRGILDGAKDTGTHYCIRRSNGRCHLYRDDTINYGAESGRTYKSITCSNS